MRNYYWGAVVLAVFLAGCGSGSSSSNSSSGLSITPTLQIAAQVTTGGVLVTVTPVNLLPTQVSIVVTDTTTSGYTNNITVLGNGSSSVQGLVPNCLHLSTDSFSVVATAFNGINVIGQNTAAFSGSSAASTAATPTASTSSSITAGTAPSGFVGAPTSSTTGSTTTTGSSTTGSSTTGSSTTGSSTTGSSTTGSSTTGSSTSTGSTGPPSPPF